MKSLKSKLVWAGFSAYLSAPALLYAAPGQLADQPLWLGTSVKHNVMFAIDDSGSMDWELSFDIEGGTPRVDGAGNFVQPSGELSQNGWRYAYVFANGYARPYDGRRLYTGFRAIPPIPQYASARSAAYNNAYYDPNIQYDPWPDYPQYTDDSFGPASLTATKFEPVSSVFATGTVNLFQMFDTNAKTEYWKYDVRNNMVCKANGDLCGQGRKDYVFYPATYYLQDKTSTYYYHANERAPDKGVARSCATDTSTEQYLEYARHPGRYRSTETYDGSDDGQIVDGFGFDGACLTKYEIGKNQTDEEIFVNGTGNNRTVEDEKQNFANWFKYYRRRHQAMRGSLASSIQGVSGIKTGMFWLNDRRNVKASDMNDMSVDADVGSFLSDHYKHIEAVGTPLRSALYHALNQYKRADGPVTSECQKNYTLLFTDGFSSEMAFGAVGNEDGDAGEPYEDIYSGSLADIAYKGYKENIRATLAEGQVRVGEACSDASPEPWMDCNKNLHMNTYTVGLGLTGTLFGNTHHTKMDSYLVPPDWPDAGVAGPSQIDDLYHAAVNGRGEMFSAQSPALLKTALRAAIDDIVKSIGSGSAVTFNSSSLQAQDKTTIYSTLFNSSDWSGDVEGKGLDSETGDVLDLVWENSDGAGVGVAAILDERNLDSLPLRVMLTKNPSGDGVGFVWDNLTDAQRNDLRTEPTDNGGAPSGSDAIAKDRLEFFRGYRSNEGALFRKRGSLMADVINSAPVYIGNPSSNWPDEGYFGLETNRYSDFRDKTREQGGASDRTPAIYVGTNGGMLHGFNAKSSGEGAGTELIAYVPNLVYSTAAGEGLHYLTDKNYSHRYYVDLEPVAQDVFTTVNGTGTKDWRTMLVGGLRGGGKGLFALDVTDPDAFSEADSDTVGTGKVSAADTVMWEFSADDDSNLGFLVSPPVITMLNNEQWAVMFGNGYESVNGRAALMILFVEGGLDGTWSVTDKRVISTGVGVSGDKNGLSGITAVDMNNDRIPDLVYGGDVKGNMWAFDIADKDAANWGVAYQDSSGDPKELFTAVNDDGDIQPITAAPIVALNTEMKTSGFQPNVVVSFGTGQYLSEGDQVNSEVQSFYTIWDKGVSGLGRSDLSLRSLTEDDEGVRSASGTDVDWTNNLGWGLDFEAASTPGERIIQKPIQLFDSVNGPIALFNSMIPNALECSGGGESVRYAIPVLSGLNPTKPILDLDEDGDFDADDVGIGKRGSDFNNEVNVLGEYMYSANKDQSGDGSGVDKNRHNASTDSAREGRIGWNEMLDE